MAECQGASAGVAQPLLVRHYGGGQELAVGQGEVDAEPQGAGAEGAGVGELCVAAVGAHVVHAVGEEDCQCVGAGIQREVVAAEV